MGNTLDNITYNNPTYGVCKITDRSIYYGWKTRFGVINFDLKSKASVSKQMFQNVTGNIYSIYASARDIQYAYDVYKDYPVDDFKKYMLKYFHQIMGYKDPNEDMMEFGYWNEHVNPSR